MSTKPTLALVALTFAAPLLSCSMNAGAGTSTSTDNPSPASAAKLPVPRARLDLGQAELESTGAPSALIVAKTNALAARLGHAIGQDQGVRLAFVTCEQSPCGARLSGQSLEALQQAIADVEHDQQVPVSVVTRERLDPYMGRSFEADVTLAPDAAP